LSSLAADTLLEASDRVGGSLARFELGGTRTELVPSVVPLDAPRLTALLHEIDAPQLLRREPLEACTEVTPSGVTRRSLRTRDSIAWLRGPRMRRLQSIVEWLGVLVDPARPDEQTRLDDRSVEDLCQVYLGRRAYASLFAPLLHSAFGLDPHDATRQIAISAMSALGDLQLAAAFGLGAVTEHLVTRLPDVRTGERVSAVVAGGRGVRLASGGHVEADAVVLAVPPPAVPALSEDLTHIEREDLAALGGSMGYVVALHSARALQPATTLTWTAWSRQEPLACILDATPTGTGSGSILLLRARLRASVPVDEIRLADELVAAAERFVPGLRGSVRERRIVKLSGARFEVGHFRRVARLRAQAARRGQRRLVLCGSDYVGPHAEGSIASGERAAEDVLAQLHAA
jgi:protoporphyrinogen oxidase